jgi:hypothetical protein
MTILDSIPDNLVISEKDNDKGWTIFVRQFGIGDGPEPSEDELELADILIEAGYIQQRTRVWPTFGEAIEHWNQRHERADARHEAARLYNKPTTKQPNKQIAANGGTQKTEIVK